ncbi:MAG TPA: FUSC family protein, partial [Gammaproteobacteria bacterium]
AVFTAALFLSVWSRRFGGNTRQLGRIMALPFIAVLVAPGAPHAAGGPGVDLALLLAAAVIAFFWDHLLLMLTRAESSQHPFEAPARPVDTKTLPASTRMAAQMGVALVASFLLGRVLFPTHWGWVVLTAFIVCSGAIGRGDAAYKGLLRFGGALLGAVAAAGLEYVFVPHGPLAAVLIFAALFVGTWLRESNYAWWAACVTLVVALLSESSGLPVGELLGQRLLAIAVGAVCGVVACWFVLPITTRSVVRRRVADALLALEELAGAEGPEREQKLLVVRRCAMECERIAPPLRWYQRLVRCGEEHPAVWLQLMQRCADRPPPKANPELVKAVRLTRKALKDDQGVTAALRKVQSVLEA